MLSKVVLLLLTAIVSYVKADIGVCSTTNDFNTFNISDYMRFQSPNYPASMVNGSMDLICNSFFVSENENDYLWFAFINGAIMDVLISDNETFTNQKIYYESNYDVTTYTSTTGVMSFQFSDQLQQDRPWTAFDAVVLPFSPSSVSDCPFSGQTITLNKDTVIPIASDYGIFANSRNNCTWTFKNADSSNYQFKVYIKKLAENDELIIQYDGTPNLIAFDVSLYDPQVLYFMGSELKIFLNISIANEFFAIISAVPITANRKEGCTYTSDDRITTISNLNYTNGYDPFTTCNYNISIPNGYEAILDVTQFWIEAGVDKLTVSKGSQVFDAKNSESFKIKSDFDGSMFKFVADGNINQAGFSASFTPIKCECANSNFVIPCNGSSYLTPLPNGISTFCDFQDCNYTISLDSSCSMDYFTIRPTADLRNTSWLAIYINGNMFQNYTEYATFEMLPYPRSTNFTVVFHSGKSVAPFVIGTPRWVIGTTAIASPITSKIMLNSSSPTYAVWLDDMAADQAITICSPDNDLELFITNGYSLDIFDLYDSDQLTNFVSTLAPKNFQQTSPDNLISVITSKSGCFTIYCSERAGNFLSTAFFRMQKTHTKNCNTQQNIVRLNQNVPSTFTVNATNGGSCEMIVFAEQYLMNPMLSLDNFQTSSNATFTLSSGLNGNPYFDLPSNETDLWKQTALYTPALSVMAPASASLTFTTSAGSSYINEGSAKRKGILVSQLYSGNNLTIFSSLTMYAFDLNNTRSANFVVKDLSPSAIITLRNIATNENHNFTANEIYFTNGSAFYITWVQDGNNAFRIEYGFDVLVNDTEPTTTQSSSTPQSPTPSQSSSSQQSATDQSTVTIPQSTSTATSTQSSPTSQSTTPNNGFISSYHFIALFISFLFAFLN